MRKKNPRYLRFGVVAFIDLLGFSSRAEALGTEDDIKNLERDIKRIQAWFDHKPSDDLTKQVQKITAKSVIAFSDCIILSVPFESDLARSGGHFDVVMSELTNVAYAQGRCAVNGIFLRGGIDYGIWYRRGDVLISPAMIKAYHLEREACVPMIALTDSLLTYLSEHRHRKFYHKSIDPIESTFRKFENLPNDSTQHFVDYIPICLESLEGSIPKEAQEIYATSSSEEKDRMRNEAYECACNVWISQHRKEIIKAHERATVESVRAKYVWLARYHDDAVSRFFKRPTRDMLIGEL
ncbi:MAG: hypothetical protein AB7M05_19730 [Alphaproteobacteria bacterium]